ncbi:MAG: Transcriptional repressor NrdR [Planctomycetes bacterium ADurb.Bin126]|nr:MAG: Transcriptional repressor NrdR [Planctomycetes bacterium ADurb.Bin126]HOD81183.1 transcriptional regulator NrdR [Phycisphaerae bacterium]HQL72444.1 transcriptional regulator NrdR [Phycisphaerae bacterium]
MQCPFCGQDNDKVVDSRSSEGGRTVRRRRECLSCQRRYTTYERPEEAVRLTVIKKDGTRAPYDRQKILDGLLKACYKRPVTNEQIRSIVEETEERIFREFDKEVPSRFIGDEVANLLRELDKIAYVRFASVYRNFADVGELIEEARGVKDAPVIGPNQKGLFDGQPTEPPPGSPGR